MTPPPKDTAQIPPSCTPK